MIKEGQTFTLDVTYEVAELVDNPDFDAEDETSEPQIASGKNVPKTETRTYEVIAASGEVATEPGVEVLRVRVIEAEDADGVG